MGKFGLGMKQNEAGQRLREFCQEIAQVIANTLFQQHKRRLYTWASPDGQYQDQIDYILCIQRWRSSIHSAKTRRGADCGWDHELLIAKFRLKLKKVEKTNRPLSSIHFSWVQFSNSAVSNSLWLHVQSSDKMWSTGEGNGKPLQYSWLKNPMNSMKRQKDRPFRNDLN